MSQANMDLDILQETKLTYGIYTCGSAGYSVVATDAPSRHHGGVALFYRLAPHFAVEAVQKFGPNVIGFQLAKGARRWYIVGCYLAPNNTSTIERVLEALRGRPKGAELLVAGGITQTLRPQRETGERRTLRRPSQRRALRKWRNISCRRSAGGVGIGGRVGCFGTERRCVPGRNTSWVWTAVSSEMSPSGTLGKTRTITWSWVACQAPP